MSATIPRVIRIFVSSPSDVGEERRLAGLAIRELNERFAGRVHLECVLWEKSPLVATASFQEQIILPSECDVFLCILWSRLGTPLPDSFRRADGTCYASGTEYEFEQALSAYAQNGKPQIIVYRKTHRSYFDHDLHTRESVRQMQALDEFMRRWFLNEDGTPKAALHRFQTPADFKKLLEEHMFELVKQRLGHISEAAASHRRWRRSLATVLGLTAAAAVWLAAAWTIEPAAPQEASQPSANVLTFAAALPVSEPHEPVTPVTPPAPGPVPAPVSPEPALIEPAPPDPKPRPVKPSLPVCTPHHIMNDLPCRAGRRPRAAGETPAQILNGP